MADANATKTPLSYSQLKEFLKEDEELDALAHREYQADIGKFGWLVATTHPVLCTVTSVLASYNAAPTVGAAKAVKHVYRYLVHAKDLCLVNDPDVSGGFEIWSDSDFAGMYGVNGDIRSRSGSALTYNGMIFAWRSAFQSCKMTSYTSGDEFSIDSEIAQATAGSEVYAMAETMKLARHFGFVAEEKDIKFTYPIEIKVDASAAKGFAESVGKVSKMKHIDVRMGWVKELRNRDLVTFTRVPGTENLADFFTKLLLGIQFTKWEGAMMQKLPLAKGA